MYVRIIPVLADAYMRHSRVHYMYCDALYVFISCRGVTVYVRHCPKHDVIRSELTSLMRDLEASGAPDASVTSRTCVSYITRCDRALGVSLSGELRLHYLRCDTLLLWRLLAAAPQW